MSIPAYQSIMIPLLRHLSDQKIHTTRECINALADAFKLTELERKELLASGQQSIFDNRVGWAGTYLKKAGLIQSEKRGFISISDKGSKLLSENLDKNDVIYLSIFQEFIDFNSNVKRSKTDLEGTSIDLKEDKTPEETLEIAYMKLRDELAQNLLLKIKECSPEFFEKLVIDLLLKMGYGGSRKDAGKAIGKTGDEGIDGIINEDRFGLDSIYIQAKKWESATVGRPEIQKFVGAILGQRAKKGIFITTSTFSPDARRYVSSIDTKIKLIDGKELAQYMIDFDIGTSKLASYEIKRIDTDYFIED